MRKYLDEDYAASDPGRLSVSVRRYRRVRGLKGIPWALMARLFRYDDVASLREHLEYGDTRAALVVSVSPLLVAAYTDELDCVVLLHYPDGLTREHGLEVGSRLLAVHTYPDDEKLARDIAPGPDQEGRFLNVCPQIAEFLSDDTDRIEARKREIDEAEWERCDRLAQEYLERHGPCAREGSPLFTNMPADLKEPIREKKPRGGPSLLRTGWFGVIAFVVLLIHLIPPDNMDELRTTLIPRLRALAGLSLAWIGWGIFQYLRRRRPITAGHRLWIGFDTVLTLFGMTFRFPL